MPRTRLTDIPQHIGAKSPINVACVLVNEPTLNIGNAFRLCLCRIMTRTEDSASYTNHRGTFLYSLHHIGTHSHRKRIPAKFRLMRIKQSFHGSQRTTHTLIVLGRLWDLSLIHISEPTRP